MIFVNYTLENIAKFISPHSIVMDYYASKFSVYKVETIGDGYM